MGNSQSDTIKMVTNSLSQSVQNIVSNTQVSSSTKVTTAQSIKFTADNLEGCTLDFRQQIAVNSKTIQTSSFNTKESIQSLIDTSMKDAGSQNQDAINGALPTGVNNQSNSQEYIKNITDIVNNNISTTEITNLANNVTSLQQGTFNIGNCTKSTIDLDQNTVILVFSDQVATMITNVLSTSTDLISAITDATQKQTAANKGILDVLTDMLGQIGKMLIPLAVILVVGLIIYYLYKKSQKNQGEAGGENEAGGERQYGGESEAGGRSMAFIRRRYRG